MSKAAKKKEEVTSTESIIKPTMVFNDGSKNAMVQLFEGEQSELPLIKSIGYMRLPDSNTYVSYVITTQGYSVVSIEVEEPNLRYVAEEASKISFVSTFMNEEF